MTQGRDDRAKIKSDAQVVKPVRSRPRRRGGSGAVPSAEPLPLLDALLRHTTDGLFMIDAECRMRLFNEACERITGYRAKEVLNQKISCHSVFACFDPACCAADADKSGGGHKRNEVCFKRTIPNETREMRIETKDGQPVWVEVSYAPVADDRGRVAWVLGILRDVTRRHQLEEQLHLARKLATLGELTSAMAHEIKNPLGIILSAAEIVGNPGRPEEQRRQAAEFIREEVRRLDERMRVFLNFSRPRPPEFKAQDVHRVLAQTILAYEILARDNLHVHIDAEPGLPEVRIDADQMQQVFFNLLVNADHAMPGGGSIHITTRRAGEGRLAVEIADEGIGLPEGDPARLFEPFFTTRPNGTGLGLAIVMHIVSAHQGHVTAANREGGPGAVFTVTLPVAGDAVQ